MTKAKLREETDFLEVVVRIADVIPLPGGPSRILGTVNFDSINFAPNARVIARPALAVSTRRAVRLSSCDVVTVTRNHSIESSKHFSDTSCRTR